MAASDLLADLEAEIEIKQEQIRLLESGKIGALADNAPPIMKDVPIAKSVEALKSEITELRRIIERSKPFDA